MAWGVFQEIDDENFVVALHTVPMIKIDGELHRSAAHDLSETCQCHPRFTRQPNGFIRWDHNDPDHEAIQEEGQEVN